jgi:hypothetical protein
MFYPTATPTPTPYTLPPTLRAHLPTGGASGVHEITLQRYS